MPYISEIKEPAALIKQFLHLFNGQTGLWASYYRTKPTSPDVPEAPEWVKWRHGLQNQQFLTAGMVLALGRNLVPPLGFNDTTGRLIVLAGSLLTKNPEDEAGVANFVEITARIRKLCHENLKAFADQ